MLNVFSSKIRVLCQIIWKNMVKPDRHGLCTLDGKGYNHTLSGYPVRLAWPLQQLLHEVAPKLRSTYSGCLVLRKTAVHGAQLAFRGTK